MRVTVRYFAVLAEAAAVEAEELELQEPCSAQQMYVMLRDRYGFTLDSASMRVAVNHAYVPFSYILQDGDSVVFIPPVSGG